jgi:organic radical activating enzyme
MSNVHKDLSQHFCPRPFEFLEIHDNGSSFVCCPNWLPKAIGNLERQEISQVWNSTAVQEIRKSILDGSFKYCSAQECPYIQSRTLPYKKDVEDHSLREYIDQEITYLSRRPKILNLCYDRSCNLSCPSCRTAKIVIWGKEYALKKVLQENILKDNLEDAEKVIITGSGDPFASRLFNELLTTLDATQYPRLRIHLMTNGVLFTPQAWQRWHKAHAAIKSLQVSVDAATEETYLKVRCGGDFHRLQSNLQFICSLRKQTIFDFFSIDFVVQAINFREMRDFIFLGKQLQVDRVAFTRIKNWGTYSAAAFQAVAIHFPDHPDHNEFLTLLKDPLFHDPIVDMGNLAEFLPDYVK